MASARISGDPSSIVGSPTGLEIDAVVASYLKDFDPSDLVAVPMVEQAFYADIGLVDVHGVPVLLYGFIDAVVETAEGQFLVEHKTAGRAWSQGQFVFDYQTRLYSSAVEAVTGIRPLGTLFNFFYPKRHDTKLVYVTPEESSLLIEEVQRAIHLRDAAMVVRSTPLGLQRLRLQEPLPPGADRSRLHPHPRDRVPGRPGQGRPLHRGGRMTVSHEKGLL